MRSWQSGAGWSWHDVGHPLQWVEVREAIEQAEFAETVEHIDGTMVAFLRKGGQGGPTRANPIRLLWEVDFDGVHLRLCRTPDPDPRPVPDDRPGRDLGPLERDANNFPICLKNGKTLAVCSDLGR
jgi:hypothetical protein